MRILFRKVTCGLSLVTTHWAPKDNQELGITEAGF